MPSVRKADPALCRDFRRTGIHIQAQLCPGEDHIQVCHNADRVFQRLGFGSNPVAEFPEDAAFFRIDIDQQLIQFLAHGTDCGRLHEYGGTLSGDFHNMAGKLIPEAFLDRQHIGSAPPGDIGISQFLFVV